jgi:hypothetical protein
MTTETSSLLEQSLQDEQEVVRPEAELLPVQEKVVSAPCPSISQEGFPLCADQYSGESVQRASHSTFAPPLLLDSSLREYEPPTAELIEPI